MFIDPAINVLGIALGIRLTGTDRFGSSVFKQIPLPVGTDRLLQRHTTDELRIPLIRLGSGPTDEIETFSLEAKRKEKTVDSPSTSSQSLTCPFTQVTATVREVAGTAGHHRGRGSERRRPPRAAAQERERAPPATTAGEGAGAAGRYRGRGSRRHHRHRGTTHCRQRMRWLGKSGTGQWGWDTGVGRPVAAAGEGQDESNGVLECLYT